MNKIVLITGANGGIGKESARQLALINETEKIYLACRNLDKALAAKQELEETTGRKIFEILIVDVSDVDSVRNAVRELKEPVDALIMNAGGMGGKTPAKITKSGATQIFATNVLGHTVLVDELLASEKLNNVALYASSEAARGIKKMGIPQPQLKNSSVEEFASVIDGSFFKEKMDPMEAYGLAKYSATMWMSAMARKHPEVKFVSVSPGGTRGTNAMDSLPGMMKFMYKYVLMPIVLPLMGMSHRLELGAKRFVDGIQDSSLRTGGFYASKAKVLTGPVIDQSTLFTDLSNEQYQENAYKAIHQFR